MTMDTKQWPIEVMVNRTVRGKMPATATPHDWARYHSQFAAEQLTAYELAANVYRGFSFCPVYHGRRKQENFAAAWHVAFDFDCAGIDALQQVRWVDYFVSFAYSTPSSTPDAPKCRAVFVFETPITSRDEYRDTYHALAWRFGENGLETDPACKDVLRLYYGSPGCDVWPNWSIITDATRAELINQWRECGPARPMPVQRPAFSGQPSTADEAKIREALRYIPSWGDYDDWLRVLMAVHSVMPGEDGVALVESWSPGKQGEVARKFEGFTQDKPGGVSLGTLFSMAKDYGYKPTTARTQRRTNGFDIRTAL